MAGATANINSNRDTYDVIVSTEDIHREVHVHTKLKWDQLLPAADT